MNLRRDVFQAIADPTRRAILMLVATQSMTAGAIASNFDTARPTVPQCKEVFIRCKMQGLSYKQVAAELAITEGTVNSQMVKALRSIREYITFKNAALALLVFLSNLLD